MIIRKTFRFEASHILPKHSGKCSRLHGHSWVLHVAVKGDRNSDTGFVMDYADLSTHVKPLIERLDHHHLGSWNIHWMGLDGSPNWNLSYKECESWSVHGLPTSFYPTSENLLFWIGGQLKDLGLDWFQIALEETCTSYAELTRDEFEGR